MDSKNNGMSLLFSSKEQPFGYSWQYWTTRWWKWFLSIPKENSPALDSTGKGSTINQADPRVWFLASTVNGRAVRTVNVPSGKALLFPIINVTISHSEDPTLNNDAEMISFVKTHMDDIVKKQASIDGKALLISEKFRIQSPPFDFYYPPNNIFGAREGPTRGVGDGYWIFIKPMEPAKHIIRTYGSCMSGKIQIESKIQLIVEKSYSLVASK
jgi:hypothetical protein